MAIDYTQKSYWLNIYGPYTPDPSLKGDLKVDVAIIGGGFTGLSAAYFLRKANPALNVAVLEGEVVGYGASGRNGGFAMTLFGLEPSVTAMLFGKQCAVEAHRYCERAVDLVRDLVKEHNIQSDFEYTGFLRIATTPGYVRRIHHDLDLLTQMGVTGITWLDADQTRAEVNSPLALGAWWEPRCGLLNPAKHVREMKRVAQSAGAVIYEQTPVAEIRPKVVWALKRCVRSFSEQFSIRNGPPVTAWKAPPNPARALRTSRAAGLRVRSFARLAATASVLANRNVVLRPKRSLKRPPGNAARPWTSQSTATMVKTNSTPNRRSPSTSTVSR